MRMQPKAGGKLHLRLNTDTSPIAQGGAIGAWGKEAQGLVSELGGRLAALTGEPRSLTFLRQRLGIAMMRGNAAAIRGTLPDNISPLAP